MVVAILARRLLGAVHSYAALAIGLALCAIGEFALSGLGTGSSWAALVPGLAIAGIGSGLANPSLGRLAVESVPRERAGLGSGSNNTARYIGGAAGVALVVLLVSTGGSAEARAQLLSGWDLATIVCGALCLLGAADRGLVRPRARRGRVKRTRPRRPSTSFAALASRRSPPPAGQPLWR